MTMSKFVGAAAGAVLLAGCAVAPQPLSLADHQQRVFDDVARLRTSTVPLAGSLTREEGIARGLLYNLDHRVRLPEEVVPGTRLSVANIEMLPRLAVNAGYTNRNKLRASRSVSLFTGRTSLEPSYSEEEEVAEADLSFTWNLLDFGLSYFRAKQQADRALIAVERRRQVMNNLTLQIEAAFLEALTAQRLLPRVERLIGEADRAERRSRQIESEGLASRSATLEFQRDLVQTIASLKELRATLAVAKSRVASLTNLPAGTDFHLSGPAGEGLPRLDAGLGDLQRHALVHRPELREAAYQTRIEQEGVRAEILGLFPELTLLASVNASSNDLLANDEWGQAGLRATWNLVNVLRGPRAIEAARGQVTVADARRLALTAAVMVQVAIGRTEYHQAVDAFASASKLSRLEGEILGIASREAEAEGTELERIQRSAQAIAAELARDNAYVEARLALSRLLVSLGLDVVPPGAALTELDATTAVVRDALARIDEGRLSGVINAALTTPGVALSQ